MQPEYETPKEIESVTGIEPAPDLTAPPEKRFWGFWPTVGFALAIGALTVMAQTVLMLGMLLTNLEFEALTDPLVIEDYIFDNLGYFMGWGTLLSAVLGTAAIAGVIKIRKGASVKEYLGLRRISLKTLGLVFLITLLMIVAAEGLSTLLGPTVETEFDIMLYSTSVWPVLFWLALVVFAPLHEEVIFRGFLFAGLCDTRFGVAGAIVITSLAWAALHVQYNIYLMGIIFVMGLVLGYVRYRTKSLWSVLLIHAGYNLAAALLIVLNVEGILGK